MATANTETRKHEQKRQPASNQTENLGSRASVRRHVGLVPTWALALASYLLIGILTIGWHAILHPRTICTCVGTEDPAQYMWAMSWWPHAVVHGLNPFVTHYLWSPTGVNTAQAALIPTAAFAMTPFTLIFGQIFSYNVLSILSPVLSAFTAYLLCRRLVGREWPALAGGYLFGSSSYEFAQLTGHLNLTLIFLIPVMGHIALRRFDREISRAAYILLLGALFVLQAGLSTELLAECVGFGAILLITARFQVPVSDRLRVDRLIKETIGAGILALVVGSPFFYYALFSGSFPKGASGLSDVYGLDLLNTTFPTLTTWLGRHDFLSLGLTYEKGNITEAGGYLSVVLILVFLSWLIGTRRDRPLRLYMGILAGTSFLAALGSHLHVAGYQTFGLPFNWVRDLPVINDIIPSRIILFTTLAVAIGIAAWLANPTGHAVGRWLLISLSIVMLFPNITSTLYGVPPRNPGFFSNAEYKRYLTPGETVLVLPFGHNDVSTLWQAETGFYFYMPEGYISGVVPPPFDGQITVGQLVANVPPSPPDLGSFIREHAVSHVVVDVAQAGPWPALLAQLGLHPQSVGGVLLYPVPGAPA